MYSFQSLSHFHSLRPIPRPYSLRKPLTRRYPARSTSHRSRLGCLAESETPSRLDSSANSLAYLVRHYPNAQTTNPRVAFPLLAFQRRERSKSLSAHLTVDRRPSLVPVYSSRFSFELLKVHRRLSTAPLSTASRRIPVAEPNHDPPLWYLYPQRKLQPSIALINRQNSLSRRPFFPPRRPGQYI